MTITDIRNHQPEHKCFWCQSSLGEDSPTNKFIALVNNDNQVIEIKAPHATAAAPMVFCCSDCMVYESHLRYETRVKTGSFRKQFATTYEHLDRLPANWKGEGEDARLIKK